MVERESEKNLIEFKTVIGFKKKKKSEQRAKGDETKIERGCVMFIKSSCRSVNK